MDEMTLFSAALLMFLVMDPLGNVPLFLTALKSVERSRYRRVIVRELLIALFVLIVFMFLGPYVLKLLGIRGPSLSIAGGIVLFIISIKMIFPNTWQVNENLPEGEPFVVPLAIPLVAGPSALTSVSLIMSREPDRWPTWLVALLLAWLVSSVILLLSTNLARFLGKRGLVAMERLMGMVLTAVAVQMFMDGLATFLNRP